jgi:shikimate kinase
MSNTNRKNNIILIGMPGCGKSSLGVVLAKAMGYSFVDSDILIQEREGMLLQEIIDSRGAEEFSRIEEEINCSYEGERTVVATGGSAVYSEKAMKHFDEIGTIVYIKLPLETIEKRIYNLEERGIVIAEGRTIKDLYEERTPLYEKYARVTVATDGLSIRESVARIKAVL